MTLNSANNRGIVRAEQTSHQEIPIAQPSGLSESRNARGMELKGKRSCASMRGRKNYKQKEGVP